MQYKVKLLWERKDAPFNTKSFDRTHKVRLGGGLEFDMSSAPEFLGRAELPNPEELFSASISSCFMLTFLYWAAAQGIVVNQYTDEVVGKLGKNADGKLAMIEVQLNPKVSYQDDKKPDAKVLEELFKKAEANCFISNSVKTKIILNT